MKKPKLALLQTDKNNDIAANDTLAQFAAQTEEVSVEIDRMSAFVIIAFDQQGNPYGRWYSDDYFPIPVPMVPDIVKKCVEADIYNP